MCIETCVSQEFYNRGWMLIYADLKLAFHLYQKLIRLFFFYFDDSVCDQLRYE